MKLEGGFGRRIKKDDNQKSNKSDSEARTREDNEEDKVEYKKATIRGRTGRMIRRTTEKR